MYLHAHTAQTKKGQKCEKRSKKAENSPAHPLARAKKEFIALIIKTKITKIYDFEVSVIKIFFQNEKKIRIIILKNSPKFKKIKFE